MSAQHYRHAWRRFARSIRPGAIYRYQGRNVAIVGQPIRVRRNGRLYCGWVHLRSLDGKTYNMGTDGTRAVHLELFARHAQGPRL